MCQFKLAQNRKDKKMRRKLIDYNEIQFMHGCAFEQYEQRRATPYSEILQYYCETAMDFVDLMKSNKYGIDEVPDFSFATFHTFVIGVALCQFENLELGMNVVDALNDVKNQMSGYFFFTLYNEAIRQDLEPKIYVNDDETGFILETEDDGPLGCVDIEESLERAFENLDIIPDKNGYRIYCDAETFFAGLFFED